MMLELFELGADNQLGELRGFLGEDIPVEYLSFAAGASGNFATPFLSKAKSLVSEIVRSLCACSLSLWWRLSFERGC